LTRLLAWPSVRFAALAACVAVAIAIAHEVHEGQPIAVDLTIMEAVHAHASPFLDALMRALTFTGGPIGSSVVTVCAAAILALRGERVAAIALVAGVIFASLLDAALKETFERVRPQLWPHAPVPGDSFPSGHAVTSIVLYGGIAALFGRDMPRYAVALAIAAGALVAGIAFSRVYLGVHWPTDVVAGVAIGYVCLIAMLAAERNFHRRTHAAKHR
jgi:membrane-associated phospholipid phosphatase